MRGQRFGAWLVAVLMALSLGLAGFGHKPLRPQGVDLAAYAMADGTVPELCLTGQAGGEAGHEGCPVCVIAKAFVLAAMAEAPALPLAFRREVVAVVAVADNSLQFARAPPARGPPEYHLI